MEAANRRAIFMEEDVMAPVQHHHQEGHQPKYIIDDETDIRPDDWDEDEDGPWEPREILNPEYINGKPNHQIPTNHDPAHQDHDHHHCHHHHQDHHHYRQTFWEKLGEEVRETIPWVTLGILITGLATCILSLVDLASWWKGGGNNSTASSLWWAALLGLATPLCSCGTLPVAAGFWNHKERGNSSSRSPTMAPAAPLLSSAAAIVAFVTASQSAGIDSAAITYGLLGPTAALARLLGAMVLAVVAGKCMPSTPALPQLQEKSFPEKQKEPPSKDAAATPLKRSKNEQTSSVEKLFWVTVRDTAFEILPTVLLGLTLSTAFVHYVPSSLSAITRNSSGNVGDSMTSSSSSSMLTTTMLQSLLIRWSILVLALPLQLCEHSTVTLAAAIQKSGTGSPGLAFGFLLSAPSTNLPTLLLLAQKMTTSGNNNNNNSSTNVVWLILRMALAISGTSLVFSYLVDYWQLDLLVVEEDESSSSGSMVSFPDWYAQLVSPLLATSLFVAGAVSRWRSKSRRNNTKEDPSSCCSDCGPSIVTTNGSKETNSKKDN